LGGKSLFIQDIFRLKRNKFEWENFVLISHRMIDFNKKGNERLEISIPENFQKEKFPSDCPLGKRLARHNFSSGKTEKKLKIKNS